MRLNAEGWDSNLLGFHSKDRDSFLQMWNHREMETLNSEQFCSTEEIQTLNSRAPNRRGFVWRQNPDLLNHWGFMRHQTPSSQSSRNHKKPNSELWITSRISIDFRADLVFLLGPLSEGLLPIKSSCTFECQELIATINLWIDEDSQSTHSTFNPYQFHKFA